TSRRRTTAAAGGCGPRPSVVELSTPLLGPLTLAPPAVRLLGGRAGLPGVPAPLVVMVPPLVVPPPVVCAPPVVIPPPVVGPPPAWLRLAAGSLPVVPEDEELLADPVEVPEVVA